MARNAQHWGLILVILGAACVATAQDILGKMLGTNALWSCTKKDTIHSHLQRMLQVETESGESESLESCSPASLTQINKCYAQHARGANLAPESSSGNPASKYLTSVPNCTGSGCLLAPMPGETAPGVKAGRQAPAQKAATYGPMTQEAFGRMVQRKRAALHAALKRAGSLTAELDAFLKTSKDQLKDAFGIPLPAGSKEPRPRADFDMRYPPQSPAPAPAPAPATTATTANPTASDVIGGAKSSAPSDDFEMRFEPQTPALDPHLLRKELEDFIAAASPAPAPSPAPQGAAHHGGNTPTTSDASQRENGQPEVEAADADVSAPSGPARPPMTAREAARLAAQQAKLAAREAALARKRQMIQDGHAAVSSGKKAKRAAANTTSTANFTAQRTAAAPIALQQQRQKQHEQQRRDRTASATAKSVKRGAVGVVNAGATDVQSGKLGYLLVALLAVAAAVGLFVAAAVMEDALLGHRNYRQSSSGGSGADWLALTHGLWRRCRRAFFAARKQLTGHGSDLPLSVNEGAGPLARAFAAAAAFVHVFWTHLVDSRGQHLAGAVTAAIDASRRASQGGGFIAPDRSSAGGGAGPMQRSSSFYESNVSPFAAPQYQQQQRRRM